jgi:TPR repeat protein
MGFSMASYNLAQLYHSGDEGIPADRDKAFAYLQLALVQYDYLNNDVLNEMADWIIDDPDQSDPVLIEQSLRLAEFLVANGDHEAMRTLGYYYNRQDDDFSRQQAYKYFLMLAQRQNVDGMVRVAAKLHKGDGVGRDPEGSLRWYRNALDKAPLNRYANYMIGLAYYDAEVVEQDYPTAIRYFRTGLEQGNDGPAEYLGWLYRKGLGCEQDDVQAYAYYLLAGDTLSGGSRDTMANIAAELSPEQLQRAEAIARDFRSQYWDEEQD